MGLFILVHVSSSSKRIFSNILIYTVLYRLLYYWEKLPNYQKHIYLYSKVKICFWNCATVLYKSEIKPAHTTWLLGYS